MRQIILAHGEYRFSNYMAALARFIPLSEAARRMRVSVKETRAMISSGKIQGGVLPDGEMVVSINSIPVRKVDLPEYKKYSGLNGVKIGVGEAARKYGIPDSTLHRWAVNKKFIAILERDGQKVLLNEQDVAYCAEVYKQHKGQGKRVFNSDGTPYKPKNGSSLAV